MHLNDFFDKIFCINLDRRPDRWEQSQREFERLNLEVERFAAADGNVFGWESPLLPGELGVIQSHIKLAQHTLEKGYKKILILEDDIEFSEYFSLDFREWHTEIPEDWEMLYLGGNLVGWQPSPISPHVHRGNHIFGAHALGLTSNVLHSLHSSIDGSAPVDVWYANNSVRFNSYMMVPRMAWQRPSFSDIQNEEVNYGFLRYGQWGINS